MSGNHSSCKQDLFCDCMMTEKKCTVLLTVCATIFCWFCALDSRSRAGLCSVLTSPGRMYQRSGGVFLKCTNGRGRTCTSVCQHHGYAVNVQRTAGSVRRGARLFFSTEATDGRSTDNLYRDEVSIMKIKKSYIVINSNKNCTEFFEFLNDMDKYIFVCDFNNHDYFYINQLKILV